MGEVRTDGREIEITRTPIYPGRLRLRFLSDLDGMYAHWVGKKPPHGHSEPCRGEGVCPHGLHSLIVQWRGYAPMEFWDRHTGLWWPSVLEITERMYWCLEGVTLRGTMWDVFQRPGRRDRKECVAEHLDDVDPQHLRTDVDFRAAVKRMYHNTPIVWGKLPLMGRPQVLAPSVPDANDAAERAVVGEINSVKMPEDLTPEEKRAIHEQLEEGRRKYGLGGRGGAK